MDAPSRLKEYPVGTTRPTASSRQPAWRSFCIMRGMTVSLEAVPSASSISSRV